MPQRRIPEMKRTAMGQFFVLLQLVILFGMDLSDLTKELMQEGKGILSSGETTDVESERMKAFGVETEELHRAYRELLFTTPGIEEHLSGIVLSEEALNESGNDTGAFTKFLSGKSILVGAHLGDVADLVADISEKNGEALTAKLESVKSHDAVFVAFSVRTDVSDEPITDSLQKNIELLSLAAKISHASGIIPLLELDASMLGAHSAAQAEDMILELATLLSDSLKKNSIEPSSTVIGVSMATTGSDNPAKAPAAEVAERTVRALTTALPSEIGGVVFLSDTQTPEEGTQNLNALARLEPLPWPIAFCFSRALHEPVLATWKGVPDNAIDAQVTFNGRLSLLSRADAAAYSAKSESL